MHLGGQGSGERGYALAALLVSLGVMAVLMSVALPVWRQQTQREKEEELIFRGQQYARAVALYQRKVAGAYPLNIDLLVDQKFLRKKYKDPMMKDGEFEILYQATVAPQTSQPSGSGLSRPSAGGPPPSPAQPGSGPQGTTGAGPRGGIVGVASKSKEKSLRIYNGRTQYNEWQFIYTPATTRPTGPVSPQDRPGGGAIRDTQRPPQGIADPARPLIINPRGPTGRPDQPPR